MKSLGKIVLVVLGGGAALAGLVVAYTVMHKEVLAEVQADKPLEAPRRVEVVNGENVVALTAVERSTSDVGLATLPSVRHQSRQSAYGAVIDLAELTDLRNALLTTRAQLAKATAALGVARTEHERVKRLYEANQNVAEKTVQAAEGAWKTEEANVLAAQAAVEATEAQAQQRWGPTVAGWLTKGGAQFDRLLRREEFLLQVSLAPSLAGTSPPDIALVQLADGREVKAMLVSAAARTDPKIQGPGYFYVVPANGTGLLPGMNVVVSLPVGEIAEGVLVPASAVVWTQGKAWAYVQIGPDRYARRPVSTVHPAEGGWLQPPEFGAGQPVVVRGAQLLLSEEFRAQITVSS